jgi:flavorubredoxin
VDHTGNLAETLEMCPNATLVSSWFQVERMTCDLDFPMHRVRWVNDGESFHAGDRDLAAIRPPLYDSPTTRGLYDPKTGVYWGSDFFATPVLEPADDTAEMDPEFLRQGLWQFHSLLAPWHALVDDARFQREVDRIAKLELNVVVGAHSPPTTGPRIQDAITVVRQMPKSDIAPVPGQADLEAMVAAMSGHN